MLMRYVSPVLLFGSLFILAGCGGVETEARYPTGYDRNQTGNDIYGERESILGDGGLKILGGRDEEETETTGIGVNGFLWRASLDTVSFMPLASADPFGGVILTDWYTPDSDKEERYKINVFIIGRSLRSDGIKVRLFKQIRQGGQWTDVQAGAETARTLEDTILTRARQLRVAQLDSE